MAILNTILFTTCLQQVFWHFGLSSTIALEECRPPDFPDFGDYGPKHKSYRPGDVIHYFCNPDYYIGGNYRRVCVDSGEWSGDTPVCDGAAIFTEFEQTTTADPQDANDARRAIDGDRGTCSKTQSERNGAEWNAIFRDFAREVIRFMVFLPKGQASYEVSIIKADGTEVSCGKNRNNIVINDWVFHNCPQPNNTGAIAVKVKSLNRRPLEICEVVVHTLTDPTCVDPHFQIDNGRLKLSRKTATLVCDEGYARDGPLKLDCIRTGVWSRRNLYCKEKDFETEEATRVSSNNGCPPRPGDPITSGDRPRGP